VSNTEPFDRSFTLAGIEEKVAELFTSTHRERWPVSVLTALMEE